MNTYGYVGGNPLLYIDPFGLTSITANGSQASSGASSSSSAAMSNIIRTSPAGIAASSIVYSPSAGEGSDLVPPPPYFSDNPIYPDDFVKPDTSSEQCTTQVSSNNSEPPHDPRERCMNGVELQYAACLQSGRNPAICAAKRVLSQIGCLASEAH